jgi:8-oxo-dGTP diphosphatase
MQSEPRVGCGAAIITDGRILLVQRKTMPEASAWGLPGGKIDLFETARDATVREVCEELDIVIETLELLCFTDQIDRALGTHWVAPAYLVQRFEGTPHNVEPEKHAAVEWFALDALPAPLTSAKVQALAAWHLR